MIVEEQQIQRCQSSVKIARNAKGEATYEVKAYADDIDTAMTLATDADIKLQGQLQKKA